MSRRENEPKGWLFSASIEELSDNIVSSIISSVKIDLYKPKVKSTE